MLLVLMRLRSDLRLHLGRELSMCPRWSLVGRRWPWPLPCWRSPRSPIRVVCWLLDRGVVGGVRLHRRSCQRRRVGVV